LETKENHVSTKHLVTLAVADFFVSVLGSWDAEEFGLQGSTEWVESHLPWLTSTAVAYLNMDVGVSGPRTAFSGSGEIQTFVVEQMKKILFPETWGDFPTLYDMWYNTTEGEISPLGSGSDYASFYQNGIGCVRSLFPIVPIN
jgi:N-acetylated-alpha-linked acidic dipeptidase